MTITEIIAQAIEARLPLDPASEASWGYTRQMRSEWMAEDALVTLDAAGYVIVPREPTAAMAKIGVHVAETGAVLGAWEAMVNAAPDHIMPPIQEPGPLESGEGDDCCPLSDDEGLICLAANSMSEPLTLVSPGVVYIKADAAQMILDRARELSGAE